MLNYNLHVGLKQYKIPVWWIYDLFELNREAFYDILEPSCFWGVETKSNVMYIHMCNSIASH